MAADISQLRAIIVVCSIVTISFLLISWIPSNFYAPTQTGRGLEAPDYFSAVDIERYGDYFNETMDGSWGTPLGNYYAYTTNVGGHTLEIWYVAANSSSSGFVNINHCEVWGGFTYPWGKHAMTFYHQGVDLGTAISKDELNSTDDYKFEFECDHINLDLAFAYNLSTYTDPITALDHNELIMLIGVEWDEMATGMSAWDFIAAIMFFNLPETHWMITAIIAVPLWLGLLYAAITMILIVLDLLPFT